MSDVFRDFGVIEKAGPFLSDVHLKRKDIPQADLFLDALKTLCGAFPYVFILGDLFEFWAGPGHIDSDDYRYVLGGMDSDP